jgi:membrane protein YqaA with SNARE-associated domain
LLALFLSTILVAAAGSVLPFSPIEPFLLALPALAPRALLVPLAVTAAVAHMAGKVVLYLGSDRLMRVLPAARANAVEQARKQLERRPLLRNFAIFLSAFVGLPPFYAVTIVAAALKVPMTVFITLGLLGRSARFVTLVLIPQLFIQTAGS